MNGVMARPLRVQYPGAVYHLMARGDHGQAVFKDDFDCNLFLQTLGEACEKTGWRVYAYVLMANHYHLLAQTPEPNLVAGMKWLQGVYTQRYNARHGLHGHLFQGRYKSVLVDGRRDENHVQVVSTYIHLNPARARLIRIGEEPLKAYRWSSYPAYLSRPSQRPWWLSPEPVLESLHLGPRDTRGYEAYLEGRTLELATQAGRRNLEAQWHAVRRGWYVGGESFRKTLEEHLDQTSPASRRDSQSGAAREAHDDAAALRLLQRGLAALELDAADLAALPKNAPQKQVLACWLRQRTTVSLRWLGERLHMGHFTRVSQAVSQVRHCPNPVQQRLHNQLAQAGEGSAATPQGGGPPAGGKAVKSQPKAKGAGE